MSSPEKIDVIEFLINLLNERKEKIKRNIEKMEIIGRIIQKDLVTKEPPLDFKDGEDMEKEKKVLIVDDDKSLLLTFNLILENFGFFP